MNARTPASVAQKYGCSLDAARLFCDLREEGYSRFQAELIAGLADPVEPQPRVATTTTAGTKGSQLRVSFPGAAS